MQTLPTPIHTPHYPEFVIGAVTLPDGLSPQRLAAYTAKRSRVHLPYPETLRLTNPEAYTNRQADPRAKTEKDHAQFVHIANPEPGTVHYIGNGTTTTAVGQQAQVWAYKTAICPVW